MIAKHLAGLLIDLDPIPLHVLEHGHHEFWIGLQNLWTGNGKRPPGDMDPRSNLSTCCLSSSVIGIETFGCTVQDEGSHPTDLSGMEVVGPHEGLYSLDVSVIFIAQVNSHLFLQLKGELILMGPRGEMDFIPDVPEKILRALQLGEIG